MGEIGSWLSTYLRRWTVSTGQEVVVAKMNLDEWLTITRQTNGYILQSSLTTRRLFCRDFNAIKQRVKETVPKK